MSRIKAFVKSNSFMYVLIALFSLFLACISDNYDYDLYARLIVGEHFFKTGWISYEDFLSYTPTHLWFDHEWGASLIFYAFLKIFGNFGLVLVQAITIFFTTFFVIKTQQLQKHAYPVSMAFILGFMCLFSHHNPSIVRCHMFSFMFFSMLLYFLEKTRRFNSNILWLMPFVVIVWNNLHGGVVSGLGIIFVYMVGELFSKRPWRKYFCVLLVSVPLLVINPYGSSYLDFLFMANTMGRKNISEWLGVFAKRHVMYYYTAFCTSVFTILLSGLSLIDRKNFNITKFLVLIVTSTLGVLHVKLLSLLLIVVVSLYYNEIATLLNKNCMRFLNKAAYVVIVVSLLFIPHYQPVTAKTNLNKYPVQEVEFIKLNGIKGNIITAFGLGSYVSYKLYPHNLIYMDGRYEEVYYNQEFDNLIYFESADKDKWDIVIKEYPTQILMPDKSMPIYDWLKKQSDWEEVYSGNVCGIFLPKNRKKYIQKFVLPTDDIEYYQKLEFDNLGAFGES